MKFRVGYARRMDGASTAFGLMGAGPPLLIPPVWLSHLNYVLYDDKTRDFYERLADHYTLIFYDRHGCGLSDRDRTNFTLEDDALDIEGVLDSLRIQSTRMLGISSGGPIAIYYASHRSNRVSQLALYGTEPGTLPGQQPGKASDAIRQLILREWGSGSEVLLRLFLPKDASGSAARRVALIQSASMKTEMAAALWGTVTPHDLRPILPNITASVMVIHRRGDKIARYAAACEMASLLPGAKFEPLEGDIHMPSYGDSHSVLALLVKFFRAPTSLEGSRTWDENALAMSL